MKSLSLINALGLIAAILTVILFGIAVAGTVIQRRVPLEVCRMATEALVVAVALRGIWNIGVKVARIEEQQTRLLREIGSAATQQPSRS